MIDLPLNPSFQEVLEPLGTNAANFFLAASLYHAHAVSFARAAELAGLSWQDFLQRLREHFQFGYVVADKVVLEDLESVVKFDRNAGPGRSTSRASARRGASRRRSHAERGNEKNLAGLGNLT